MRISITRFLRSTALTGLVLVSATGCQTVTEDWASVRPRPAPQAHRIQHSQDVLFAPGSDRLEAEQRERLDGFLAQTAVGPRGRVFVVGSATDTIDLRRRETVFAYLAHRGVESEPVAAGFGIETPTENTVSVIVRQYVVTLPGCPDWSGDPADTTDNLPSANWGCATAMNFGLMVAEPADLAQGRELGAMDGNTASLAIRRYRAGQTKPLNPDSVSGDGASEGGSE